MPKNIFCLLLLVLGIQIPTLSAQAEDSVRGLNDTTLLVIDSSSSQTTAETDSLPALNPLPDIEARNVNQKTWVFLFFIFVRITIGITRSINLKKHKGLLKEMTRLRISSAGFDSFVAEITAVNVMYLFIHCMIVAFAFYRIYSFEVISFDSGIQAFLFTLIMVIGVYVVKFYLYRIITFILGMGDGIRALFSVHSTLAYTFSVVAFPLLVLSYYLKSPDWSNKVMIILGLVAVVYLLYRFIKVFITLQRFFSFPRVYLFLYLCTLEILPLLVLANVVGLGWVR